jgi:ElaB/YqjD/DUF883 family membrane-anchored ribosome-binding protein
MFNLNKENIRSEADQLAQEANNTVDKVANQVKASAAKASEKIINKTEATKDQAESLINSLRNLLDEHKQRSKVDEFKEQITDKAAELKAVVTDEVTHAYATTKQRASDTVKENPVGTLVLVAGVGLLLGYVLGSKQSSQ